MNLKVTTVLLLAFAIAGCNPQPVGNQNAILEELNNREIKRVTKSEILEAGS